MSVRRLAFATGRPRCFPQASSSMPSNRRHRRLRRAVPHPASELSSISTASRATTIAPGRASSRSTRSTRLASRRIPSSGRRSSGSCARAPCRRPACGVPDERGYEQLLSYLEGELDRRAATTPDPGRTDTFRRLTRTEYQNAIRDLFARRRRCHRAAAERRRELRLRQRERSRPFADAGRTLSHGRAESDSPGRRQSPAGAGGARGDAAARPDAGRARRRPAVRHARRHPRADTRFRATASTKSRSA